MQEVFTKTKIFYIKIMERYKLLPKYQYVTLKIY